MPDNSKGLKTDFSEGAVRERVLKETAGLPPEARPGSATQQRMECIKAQTGLRGQEALRQHLHNDGDPDCI